MSLRSEINAKRAELAELEARLTTYESLPPEYQVAERLHSLLCHWNHTDGCSWEYQTWQNPGDARMRYVEKAEGVLAFIKTHNIKLETFFDLLGKIYE
jgi:hypothetical protein